MNDFSQAILVLLIDWSIRFGILILAYASWLWLRPPESIAVRLLLARLVLMAGLLLPLTPRWLSIPWPASLFPAAQSPATPDTVNPSPPIEWTSQGSPLTGPLEQEPIPSDEKVARAATPLPGESKIEPAEVEPILSEEPQAITGFRLKWPVVIVLAWGAGVVFFLVRLIIGCVWLSHIKRCARPSPISLMEEWEQTALRLGSLRHIPLVISDQVPAPALLCGWKPVVAMPSEWQLVTADDRRMALLHEAGHVAHFDDWAKLSEEIVRSFLFFHPLVHWLINRIAADREQRCDALAIRHGATARSLAKLLVAQFKKRLSQPALPHPTLAFFSSTGVSRKRIEKLLEDDMTRWIKPISALRGGFVALLVFGFAMTLGGWAPILATGTVPDPNPEEKDAIVIAGKVISAEGTPAASAAVWAVKVNWGPLIRRETIADAKGQFRLSIPPGQWHFYASKGGQGGVAQSRRLPNFFDISQTKKIDEISINMENRGWFTGRLLEAETGKPLANAQVFLETGRIATTGADGIWKVGGLARAYQEAIVVTNGRKRQRFLFDSTRLSDVPLEIQVPLASRMQGTVTDFEGKPIPNAWIGRTITGLPYGLYALCDQNGGFVFDDCVPADHPTSLTAGAPGYLEVEQQGIQIEPGKVATIPFQLKPMKKKDATETNPGEQKRRVISGVITGSDGKPAADVFLRWGLDATIDAITTTTDETGKFKMVVPDEALKLSVLPKDQAPQFPLVAKDGNREFNLTLEKGFTASGTVLDDQGKPLEGVMVRPVIAYPDSDQGNRPFFVNEKLAFTDKAGKFSIKGLPEDSRFQFMKTGFSQPPEQTLTLDDPKNEVRLSYGGAIKGKVVDAQGNPIRNFRITLNPPRNPSPMSSFGGFDMGYTGMGIHYSSPDGTFVLTGITSDAEVRVKAYAEGYGEALLERVKAVPLNQLDQTAAHLLKAEAATPLKIRVTDTKGNPLPGARVTLIDGEPYLDGRVAWGIDNASWNNMVRGRANAQGVADFPKLSFKGATVLVEGTGFARQRLAWRNREKEILVKMEKEAILAGHLKWDPEAEGTEFSAQLSCWAQGNLVVRIPISDAKNGRFLVKELPTGTWTLHVRSLNNGKAKDFGPIVLKADEVTKGEWDWNP